MLEVDERNILFKKQIGQKDDKILFEIHQRVHNSPKKFYRLRNCNGEIIHQHPNLTTEMKNIIKSNINM